MGLTKNMTKQTGNLGLNLFPLVLCFSYFQIERAENHLFQHICANNEN